MYRVCILKIFDRYKTLVENVLTSVTKTEESLRRLKKIKANNLEASAITDDQKIRMQVQLDLTCYSQEVYRININALL